MPPFDAAQAACIGFFFGAVITYLVVSEYYQKKIRELIDRISDRMEGL